MTHYIILIGIYAIASVIATCLFIEVFKDSKKTREQFKKVSNQLNEVL